MDDSRVVVPIDRIIWSDGYTRSWTEVQYDNSLVEEQRSVQPEQRASTSAASSSQSAGVSNQQATGEALYATVTNYPQPASTSASTARSELRTGDAQLPLTTPTSTTAENPPADAVPMPEIHLPKPAEPPRYQGTFGVSRVIGGKPPPATKSAATAGRNIPPPTVPKMPASASAASASGDPAPTPKIERVGSKLLPKGKSVPLWERKDTAIRNEALKALGKKEVPRANPPVPEGCPRCTAQIQDNECRGHHNSDIYMLQSRSADGIVRNEGVYCEQCFLYYRDIQQRSGVEILAHKMEPTPPHPTEGGREGVWAEPAAPPQSGAPSSSMPAAQLQRSNKASSPASASSEPLVLPGSSARKVQPTAAPKWQGSKVYLTASKEPENPTTHWRTKVIREQLTQVGNLINDSTDVAEIERLSTEYKDLEGRLDKLLSAQIEQDQKRHEISKAKRTAKATQESTVKTGEKVPPRIHDALKSAVQRLEQIEIRRAKEERGVERLPAKLTNAIKKLTYGRLRSAIHHYVQEEANKFLEKSGITAHRFRTTRKPALNQDELMKREVMRAQRRR